MYMYVKTVRLFFDHRAVTLVAWPILVSYKTAREVVSLLFPPVSLLRESGGNNNETRSSIKVNHVTRVPHS